MTSRDKILAQIKNNQPDPIVLPDISGFKGELAGAEERFINILSVTGGKAYQVNSMGDVEDIIRQEFIGLQRIVTTIPELSAVANIKLKEEDAHLLADVDLAIIKAHFGVAENGAVWITEDLMQERALPFIAQSLAVVIRAEDILPTMHEAYARIGSAEYGFAGFIAGPSKTADIEQSLVLGAHGPKSMTVFIVS